MIREANKKATKQINKQASQKAGRGGKNEGKKRERGEQVKNLKDRESIDEMPTPPMLSEDRQKLLRKSRSR